MQYSFQQYLLSKQSVDDRALNKDVLIALRSKLTSQPIRVIEVGGGIGCMFRRAMMWEVICEAEYVMVDEDEGNIEYASEWIPRWAEEAGLSVERSGNRHLRLFNGSRDVLLHLEQADVFEFIRRNNEPADLLIAHAFLDLLPMPESLAMLMSLTHNLAWLTINFDGVTTFEPTIDAALDAKIERLYHESMDTRPTGGSSTSGRHMFEHLRMTGMEILAAGASDWVVHAVDGKYPGDEEYFLHHILHFFEESLKDNKELDKGSLVNWLRERRIQIKRGELVYISHQMDFLCAHK